MPSITLYVRIDRETALAARKIQFGDSVAVHVDEDWIRARSDEELALLGKMGESKNPLGGTLNYGSRWFHDDVTIRMVEPTPEAVAEWLAKTIEASTAWHAEKDAKKAAETRQKLDEWYKTAQAWLVDHEDVDSLLDVRWLNDVVAIDVADPPRRYGLDDAVTRDTFPELTDRINRRLQEASDRIPAAKEAALAKRAENQAKAAAEKRAKEEIALAWIAEHGSEHLQQLVELKIRYAGTYREERTAYEMRALDELGTWLPYNDVCGRLEDIRDPSPEILDVYLQARKLHADVRLHWLTCRHVDCSQSRSCDGGPALAVDVLGKTHVHLFDFVDEGEYDDCGY